MPFSVRPTLLWVVAALAACGRLGYDTSPIEGIDASQAADASADASSDAPVGAPDAAKADAPPGTPDAAPPPDASLGNAKRIFISAAQFTANFGGVAQGDTLCQGYADAVGLGGTWKAWLSSATQHAGNRLTHSLVPYRRLDGALVANDWAGLTNGSLINPIDVDETMGLQVNVEVWTGTTAGGLKTMATCSDWTNGTNMGTLATVGNSSATDTTWSEVFLQFCDRNNVRLYCIEQ